MSVLDEFHEVEHLLAVKPLQAEVVKDDQVGGGELVEAPVDGGRGPGQGDVLEELQRAKVPDFVSQHAGLPSEGGGDPAFARSRRAGDEDGLSVVDVGAGGELHHLLPLKPSLAVEGQLLKACRVAEPGVVHEPGVTVRPSGVLLGLEQQLHPVLKRELGSLSCLDPCLPACGHPRHAELSQSCFNGCFHVCRVFLIGCSVSVVCLVMSSIRSP